MATRPHLIAVVDDDESVRRALKRLLRSFGLEVHTYASGAEFMRSLPDRRPDCLVLDVHMPGMSGLEVQARLGSEGVALPIVFVTAFENADDEARALAAGASRFIHKPLTEQVLLAAVDEAVREGAARQRLR